MERREGEVTPYSDDGRGGRTPSRPRGYPLRLMRVKNKELRRRRHRKDVTIKAAEKAIREQYANKAPAAAKKAPAKRAAK